jgi:hypothetical protein
MATFDARESSTCVMIQLPGIRAAGVNRGLAGMEIAHTVLIDASGRPERPKRRL